MCMVKIDITRFSLPKNLKVGVYPQLVVRHSIQNFVVFVHSSNLTSKRAPYMTCLYQAVFLINLTVKHQCPDMGRNFPSTYQDYCKTAKLIFMCRKLQGHPYLWPKFTK